MVVNVTHQYKLSTSSPRIFLECFASQLLKKTPSLEVSIKDRNFFCGGSVLSLPTIIHFNQRFFSSVLLFDDNKIKVARKAEKLEKENPVGLAGEGNRWKGNIREGSRESKTRTVLELSFRVGLLATSFIYSLRLSQFNLSKIRSTQGYFSNFEAK